MSTKNRLLFAVIVIFTLPSCAITSVNESYTVQLRHRKVIIQMDEYASPFRNTMKGLREFFDAGTLTEQRVNDFPYPYGSLIKEYMPWNKMENQITDGVDKVIAYSNHRWKGYEDLNLKVIPRAYLVWIEPWHGGKPADPAIPDDLNGWHWPSDMPNELSPYKNIPGEWGCYIEEGDSLTPITGGYFDENFPSRVERFVEKLGQAWDNDPRVAYVEMGIIGEWGEHHDPDITTFWPPHDEPEHVRNRTWVEGIDKVLGDAFSEAFKNKKVMVRYAYDFPNYQFGFYWDSWAIDEEYERGYLQMKSMGDRWKTQPIGGEITWGWGSLARKGFRSFKDCIMNRSTYSLIMEQIRNLHCNHLGGITWTDFSDPEVLDHAGDIQKALGYRYVLKKAKYDAEINKGNPWKIDFTVVNTGSSPFYYRWPVEVSLLDKVSHKQVWRCVFNNADIREWLPGEDWNPERQEYRVAPKEFHIQGTFDLSDVTAGEYIVALSILDPAGNLPSVRFANENYLNGGYTILGYVGCGKRISKPELDKSLFDEINSDHSLRYVYKNKN